MSNIQPVAFSPIEHGMGAHVYTEQAVRERGIEVIRFSRYDGDAQGNIRISEEILTKAGGLLLNSSLSYGGRETNVQAQAILDRINVASELGKPVFVPDAVWLRLTLIDVSQEQIEPIGILPLRSATGIDIGSILRRTNIVPTGPRELPPYKSMREKLQQELNTAGGI